MEKALSQETLRKTANSGLRGRSSRTGKPLVQARAEETRLAIQAAARRAFAEHGFDDANVRDIAAQAGTTHSMVTYHFGTKDELWRETVRSVFANFEKQVLSSLTESVGLPERERFIRMIYRYALYSAQHPEHARITIMETIRGGERLRWMVETHISVAQSKALSWFADLMDTGVIRRMSPVLFLYNLVAMLQFPFVVAKEAEIALGYDALGEAVVAEQAEAILLLTMLPQS